MEMCGRPKHWKFASFDILIHRNMSDTTPDALSLPFLNGTGGENSIQDKQMSMIYQ